MSASTVPADISPSPSPTSTEPHVLRRRLLPLDGASFLGALALWVPIEKLFMASIGFTAASVGVMAAVYAVVVPVLELPSGRPGRPMEPPRRLDPGGGGGDRRRRHRRLQPGRHRVHDLGGLPRRVLRPPVGNVESVVYDTVLEETGDSEAFERTIGRVRLVESVGLVTARWPVA